MHFSPVLWTQDGKVDAEQMAAFFSGYFGHHYKTCTIIPSSAKHPPSGTVEVYPDAYKTAVVNEMPVIVCFLDVRDQLESFSYVIGVSRSIFIILTEIQ